MTAIVLTCAVTFFLSSVADLAFSEFSTLSLKFSYPSTTKFFILVYLFLNSADFPIFFDYLKTCKVKHIFSSSFSEIIILTDFNVHHSQSFTSNFQDAAGELSFDFGVSLLLEACVHSVCVERGEPSQFPHFRPRDCFNLSTFQNFRTSRNKEELVGKGWNPTKFHQAWETSRIKIKLN